MDPNAALARIRQLIDEYNHAHDVDDEQRELVDAFVDLDEWLMKGGFPPHAWIQGERLRSANKFGQRFVAEPLGGPHPGVNGSHLPERDDDYTPEGMDRDG